MLLTTALFTLSAVSVHSTRYIVSQKFSSSGCSGTPTFESVIDTTKCYPFDTSWYVYSF